MPLTSVTKDAAQLTLTVVGDYPVPQQRLWDAFADPRQLERFWGPPACPATFTRHDFKVGGRAEYFLTLPEGETWSGSWKFTAVNPISSFEAHDGEDNAEDENMPASMKFAFEATPTGSRMTCVTSFQALKQWSKRFRAWKKGYAQRCPNSTHCLLNGARPLRMLRTDQSPRSDRAHGFEVVARHERGRRLRRRLTPLATAAPPPTSETAAVATDCCFCAPSLRCSSRCSAPQAKRLASTSASQAIPPSHSACSGPRATADCQAA